MERSTLSLLMKRTGIPSAFAAALILAVAAIRAGETAALTPAADTTLFERFPNNNLGSVDTLACGAIATGQATRALLRFDLKGLPPNAVVSAVELTCEVVKTPTSGGRPSKYELRRMLADWNEGAMKGSATGRTASSGETTWNMREHQELEWSSPGGAAGLDFADAASASATIDGIGEYRFASTAALVADVQFWLDEPEKNLGWIMISDSEQTAETARRIAARESAARSPKLLIHYDIPAAPPVAPRFSSVEQAGSEFLLRFSAPAGQTIRLEFATELPTLEWFLLSEIPDGSTPREVTVTNLIDRPRGYYRLRIP